MWFLEDERRLCKTRFQDYCYHPILLLNCPKVFGNAVCWALVGKELALKGGVIGTNPGLLPGKGFQSTESGLSFRNKTMTRPICPSCHDKSVNPQQGAVWLQSALTICLHMSWWSVFNFLSISEWLICVFHSDSIIRHWILAITYILFALMWSCVGVCVRTPSAWWPLAKASIAS